jgi:hypothetical protein
MRSDSGATLKRCWLGDLSKPKKILLLLFGFRPQPHPPIEIIFAGASGHKLTDLVGFSIHVKKRAGSVRVLKD